MVAFALGVFILVWQKHAAMFASYLGYVDCIAYEFLKVQRFLLNNFSWTDVVNGKYWTQLRTAMWTNSGTFRSEMVVSQCGPCYIHRIFRFLSFVEKSTGIWWLTILAVSYLHNGLWWEHFFVNFFTIFTIGHLRNPVSFSCQCGLRSHNLDILCLWWNHQRIFR